METETEKVRVTINSAQTLQAVQSGQSAQALQALQTLQAVRAVQSAQSAQSVQAVRAVNDTQSDEAQTASTSSGYATLSAGNNVKLDPRIDAETHTGKLVYEILPSYPEFRETAIIEEEEKALDALDAEEERRLAELGEDYYASSDGNNSDMAGSNIDGMDTDTDAEYVDVDADAAADDYKKLNIRRIGRRPGCLQLEQIATCIAIHVYEPDLICKLFSIGYALLTQILSEGYERRTVIWLPDCLKFEFPFNELGKGDQHLQANGLVELEKTAWTVSVLLKGTGQLENIVQVTNNQNLSDFRKKQEHYKNQVLAKTMSVADNSNTGNTGNMGSTDNMGDTDNEYANGDGSEAVETAKAAYEKQTFMLQAHIDTPDMRYAKLEAAKEARDTGYKLQLLQKGFLREQSYENKRLYYMHQKNGLSVRAIAKILGIKNHNNVEYYLKMLYKSEREYLFDTLLDTPLASSKDELGERTMSKLFKIRANTPRVRIRRKISARFTAKVVETMKEIIKREFALMLSEVSKVSAYSVSSASPASLASSVSSAQLSGTLTKAKTEMGTGRVFATSSHCEMSEKESKRQEKRAKRAMRKIREELQKGLQERLLNQFECDFIAYLVPETKEDLYEHLAEEVRKIPYRRGAKNAKLEIARTYSQSRNCVKLADGQDEQDEQDIKALFSFEYAVFKSMLETLFAPEYSENLSENPSENTGETATHDDNHVMTECENAICVENNIKAAGNESEVTEVAKAAEAAALKHKCETRAELTNTKWKEHKDRKKAFLQSSSNSERQQVLQIELEQDLFVPSICNVSQSLQTLLKALEKTVAQLIQREIQKEVDCKLRLMFEQGLRNKEPSFWAKLQKSLKKKRSKAE